MNSDAPAGECFTDYALQEFVAGRLDTAVRTQVAEHIETCPECRQAHADFGAESRTLKAAMTQRRPQKEPSSISDETLGLYLSGALEESQTASLESTLAQNPALLERLIALRTETAAARAEADGTIPVANEQIPKGQILKMPRRIRPVITVTAGQRMGGERAG